LAAATGKARLPTEDSLYDGTTRRLVAEERRGRRSAISAVRGRVRSEGQRHKGEDRDGGSEMAEGGPGALT